jgi:thioredoxin reductase (NADPH)
VATVRDILILGSGAAGYTAGIYAARANRKPLLISGFQPGGQLMITSDVENYPGFRDPIEGPALMEQMRDQALRAGVEIMDDAATRVDFSRRPLQVWTDGGGHHHARVVIVATGATAKLLGLPSESRYMGAGVSACATCDGPLFRNKRVVVVGGGDSALEEALYLTRMCSDVVIVHRRDAFRASKIMQARALANPKIRVIWDAEVAEILGNDRPAVTGVRLRHVRTGEVTEMAIDGVFVAIGHQPATAFLRGQMPMDERGYLLVTPGSTHTSIRGVFAAGDVADSIYRQAVTAAGTGCMAALDAERFLEAEDHLAPADVTQAMRIVT